MEESICQEKLYSEKKNLLHSDPNGHHSGTEVDPEMEVAEAASEVVTDPVEIEIVDLIADSKAADLEISKETFKLII